MSLRKRPLQLISANGGGYKLRYSPDIVHFHMIELFLTEFPYYPGRPRLDARLEKIPQTSLHWQVSARPSTDTLKRSVLRNALEGKWRKSMMLALEQHGYLKDGRIAETRQQGLSGTLDIAIFQGFGFDHSDTALSHYCTNIIKSVQKQQSINLLRNRPGSARQTRGW